MKKKFDKLIHEFCGGIDLPNAEKIISGNPFTINQVVFSLTHQQQVDNSLLFVHVDFGDVPKGGEIEAYYELLRENFFEFPMSNASFGISPDTGRAVYSAAYSLDSMTPQELIVKLAALTCQARQWCSDNEKIHQKTALGAASQRPYFLPSSPSVQVNAKEFKTKTTISGRIAGLKKNEETTR